MPVRAWPEEFAMTRPHRSAFPHWMRGLGKVYREQGDAIFIEAPLRGFAQTMRDLESHGIRVVNSITSYDSGKEMELLYHFVHAGQVLTVKFRLPRTKPEVPTVTDRFPSAMLFEMEAHEMAGVMFSGNTGLKSLLLSEASPKTPLRKPGAQASPGPARKEGPHA